MSSKCEIAQWELYPTGSSRVNWRVALGRLGVVLGPQGFLDTSMLVYVMRNCCIGGLNQQEWFHVIIEHGLLKVFLTVLIS